MSAHRSGYCLPTRSETADATVVTVTPSEIEIDEPGPPQPDPIMIGSLDLGSAFRLMNTMLYLTRVE